MTLVVIPKHPKPVKLPKTMGACADLLHAVKENRLAADKLAAALKAEETRISDHIIANLPKGDTGAAGKEYRAQVKLEEVPQLEPENIENFYKWVAKTGAWDCLQRRLSKEAVMARVEVLKNGKLKLPPGIKMFTAVKVSLTKVK